MIKDLGVTFRHDLSFAAHVSVICAKACSMLGFIGRRTRGIRDPATLKSLYCAFVRQALEYSSQVWSPYTAGDRNRLDAIQRRFLRMVGVRLGYHYGAVPVQQLQDDLGLVSLQTRRETADVVFLFKLLNSYVDCPELLSRIDIRCPSRTRSSELFGRRFCRALHEYNAPFNRAVRLANSMVNHVDFFADSLAVVRRRAMEVLAGVNRV